jgi:hypothetical protein
MKCSVWVDRTRTQCDKEAEYVAMGFSLCKAHLDDIRNKVGTS